MNVQVLDENDNAPEVLVNPLTESGRVEVAENADRGTFTAYVAVRDADSAKNGAAVCHVTSPSPNTGNYFRLSD